MHSHIGSQLPIKVGSGMKKKIGASTMVPASLDTTYKIKSRHRIYIRHENELKMAHRP